MELTIALPATALYWSATFLTLLVALALPDLRAVARAMQLAGGVTGMALVTVHLSRNGLAGPIPTSIDLTLLILSGMALWLGASPIRKSQAPEALPAYNDPEQVNLP